MSEVDPVGKRYYQPLKTINSVTGVLFWLVALFSLATLLVDQEKFQIWYGLIQVFFVVAALLFFVLGLAQRLYFFPRAEDKRREELLGDSYGVEHVGQKSEGYYNNDQEYPLKRLAASIMESAFFTHEVAQSMLKRQRVIVAVYLIIYTFAVFNRTTNLEILVVVAQVVFSEEVMSRWLRMEWLSFRCERVYDQLGRIFRGKQDFTNAYIQLQAIEWFAFYETTKVTSATLISSSLFIKLNDKLSEEWNQTKERLGL